MNVTNTQQYVAVHFATDADSAYRGVTTFTADEYKRMSPLEIDAKLSAIYALFVSARTRPADPRAELAFVIAQISQLTVRKAELEASLG